MSTVIRADWAPIDDDEGTVVKASPSRILAGDAVEVGHRDERRPPQPGEVWLSDHSPIGSASPSATSHARPPGRHVGGRRDRARRRGLREAGGDRADLPADQFARRRARPRPCSTSPAIPRQRHRRSRPGSHPGCRDRSRRAGSTYAFPGEGWTRVGDRSRTARVGVGRRCHRPRRDGHHHRRRVRHQRPPPARHDRSAVGQRGAAAAHSPLAGPARGWTGSLGSIAVSSPRSSPCSSPGRRSSGHRGGSRAVPLRPVDLVVIALTGVGGDVAALVPARSASRVPVLAALAGRRPLGVVPRRLVPIGLGVRPRHVPARRCRQHDRGRRRRRGGRRPGRCLVLAGMCCASPLAIDTMSRASAAVGRSWRFAGRSLGRTRTERGGRHRHRRHWCLGCRFVGRPWGRRTDPSSGACQLPTDAIVLQRGVPSRTAGPTSPTTAPVRRELGPHRGVVDPAGSDGAPRRMATWERRGVGARSTAR